MRKQAEDEWKEETVQALYFDGRDDLTLVALVDENGKRWGRQIKEHHYVITQEPEGLYLTHVTPKSGSSKDVTDAMMNFAFAHEFDRGLSVVGSDTTNPMSGAEGGVQRLVEVKVDRPCMRVFCMIHTNELPLRHLFIQFDGVTSGKDSFTGPIGKAVKTTESLELKPRFKKIPDGQDFLICQMKI